MPPQCYFVLGDHRSMSNDSRDFGAVESELHLRQGCVWVLADGQVGRVVALLASIVMIASFRIAI